MYAEKLLPHDVEAEEAIIGSLLLDGDSFLRVSSVIKAEDFYREKNAICYKSCEELFRRSEAIDQKFPDEDDYETGTVSFVFMVGVSGKPSNFVHVETQPPEFEDMQERVRRNLRHIVYRPRLEEGKLVVTRDVIFTHAFYYRPEDMPSKPSEDDSTSR